MLGVCCYNKKYRYCLRVSGISRVKISSLFVQILLTPSRQTSFRLLGLPWWVVYHQPHSSVSACLESKKLGESFY